MITPAERLKELSAGVAHDIKSLSEETLVNELEKEGLLLFRFDDLEGVSSHLRFMGTYRSQTASASPFFSISSSVNVQSQDLVAQRGGKAFTQAALEPHSDYPALASPPELNVLLCQAPAPIGGASVFVDGKMLYQRLAEENFAQLSALMQPGSILNRYDDHVADVPLFESVGGSRLRIRARFDEFAFFNTPVLDAVATVRLLINELTFSYALRSGEGYLMKNSQWLHGRESFIGSRTLHRLSINAHENFRHAFGSFDPANRPQALPR